MIEIKGTTRLCGLIGNPVEHSVSPVIHNNLAEIKNINMVYTTFKVESYNLADAVKGAYGLDILGMNVTVPHKQQVMDSLVDIDPLAKAIGAVNTLVRVDGGYKGYNTDIIGLGREMEDEGVFIKDNSVIIIGAGGASRAIAFLCADKGADKVYLLNRTIEKAQNIANAVNTYFGKECIIPMNIGDYNSIPDVEGGYVAIQTTSVGLYPNVDDTAIEDDAFYEKISVGVDIIYNPAVTMFMKKLKSQGKPAYNGLKMLLYQGIAAFELWNEVTVSKEEADSVYELMKKELGISE
ncbi:MAG: shikimate dehydrogenase [Eubacteriales bacterium]|nr:shikimate dehydrogenase [Eubacteriales bacterium]